MCLVLRANANSSRREFLSGGDLACPNCLVASGLVKTPCFHDAGWGRCVTHDVESGDIGVYACNFKRRGGCLVLLGGVSKSWILSKPILTMFIKTRPRTWVLIVLVGGFMNCKR